MVVWLTQVGVIHVSESAISNALVKVVRAKAQGGTRCHGRNRISQMAKRAGQTESIAAYLIKELTDFRNGRRAHVVMSSVASVLSDEDIQQISVRFGSLAMSENNTG